MKKIRVKLFDWILLIAWYLFAYVLINIPALLIFQMEFTTSLIYSVVILPTQMFILSQTQKYFKKWLHKQLDKLKAEHEIIGKYFKLNSDSIDSEQWLFHHLMSDRFNEVTSIRDTDVLLKIYILLKKRHNHLKEKVKYIVPEFKVIERDKKIKLLLNT
jgi:hypothetical protein